MRKLIDLIILFVFVITSSCNKDEVIVVEESTTDIYYRAKNASSQASFTKVFEYMPAPGQFINETNTGGFSGDETTMDKAVAFAANRMKKNLFVSLGGFGGYIVVGFDHSIDNTGLYDFAIKGNPIRLFRAGYCLGYER